MLFRHPKLLYALFALLIPIIIHLFKLRKFKKVAFTNVAFLEKVKLQSRKSALLKKWLVLLSRLALLGCIIFAFAKPYFPASSNETRPDHYIFYLDNSHSMQAEGNKGELLQRAIQDLIPVLQKEKSFSLFTNNNTWENTNLADIQNEILQIEYTNEQLHPNQIVLKAKKIAKSFKNAHIICISDFQDKNKKYNTLLNASNGVIQLKAIDRNNIAIDSIWLTTDKREELNIAISNRGNQTQTTLSVFNDDELLGRSTINFESNNVIKTITLPKNKAIIGKASIIDKGLSYDDHFFFSINPSSLSKIVSIGTKNQTFLNKIYTPDRFLFSTMLPSAINYAELTKANTIILNEVERVDKSLENLLVQFIKNKGTLVVIPSTNSPTEFVKTIKNISGISIAKSDKNIKKITNINFSHPSYKGVFTKSIDNFQYPETKNSRVINTPNVLLRYEDNQVFLGNNDRVFIFASSLQLKNSNFLNSPLVVPTFYKMGLKESENQSLSYIINQPNEFVLPLTLDQDQVIQFSSINETFIPLQQAYTEHLKISTTELPKKSGNYVLKDMQQNTIKGYSVSYNYDTSESNLTYTTIPESNLVFDNIPDYFSRVKAGFQTTDLWKWFIIFALIFLLIEILLLKFLK